MNLFWRRNRGLFLLLNVVTLYLGLTDCLRRILKVNMSFRLGLRSWLHYLLLQNNRFFIDSSSRNFLPWRGVRRGHNRHRFNNFLRRWSWKVPWFNPCGFSFLSSRTFIAVHIAIVDHFCQTLLSRGRTVHTQIYAFFLYRYASFSLTLFSHLALFGKRKIFFMSDVWLLTYWTPLPAAILIIDPSQSLGLAVQVLNGGDSSWGLLFCLGGGSMFSVVVDNGEWLFSFDLISHFLFSK